MANHLNKAGLEQGFISACLTGTLKVLDVMDYYEAGVDMNDERSFVTPVAPNEFSTVKKTPLEMYLHDGKGDDIDVVETLLDFGADPNNGDFAWMYCLYMTDPHNGIFELLLKRGMSMNKRDLNKETPFHMLAANDNCDAKAMILAQEHGGDANIKDIGGYTPLGDFLKRM